MATFITKLWERFCVRRDPLSIMIVGLDNSGKTSILNHLVSLNHISGSALSLSHQQSADKINSRSPSPISITGSASALKDRATANCDDRNIMPTVGYNYERIQYKNLTITVLDFSGQSRYRNLWQEFYNGVDGIVFVVDSSDLIRFVVVRDELETMLNHPFFNTLGMTNESHQQTAPSLINSNAAAAQKQFTISQGKLIQTPLDTSSSNLIVGYNSSKSIKKGIPSKSAGRRTKIPILFLANKTDLPNSVDTVTITKALNLNQLSAQRHPWLIQSTSVNSGQGITEAFDWLASQLSTTTRADLS